MEKCRWCRGELGPEKVHTWLGPGYFHPACLEKFREHMRARFIAARPKKP